MSCSMHAPRLMAGVYRGALNSCPVLSSSIKTEGVAENSKMNDAKAVQVCVDAGSNWLTMAGGCHDCGGLPGGRPPAWHEGQAAGSFGLTCLPASKHLLGELFPIWFRCYTIALWLPAWLCRAQSVLLSAAGSFPAGGLSCTALHDASMQLTHVLQPLCHTPTRCSMHACMHACPTATHIIDHMHTSLMLARRPCLSRTASEVPSTHVGWLTRLHVNKRGAWCRVGSGLTTGEGGSQAARGQPNRGEPA